MVSPGYLREQNIQIADERIGPLQAQGKTVVFVLVDGELKGAIALADIVRPEAKQAITALKAQGIRCLMLTGDNEATAKWVSEQVGVDEYFAEVLPKDKAAKVKQVQARGILVAMTGDGVNDAPALAQADLGIAIGAGSDVAVETADVILVRSNPQDVVAIVALSRATYRKMIQNLLWATGYNVVAIPLAAGALYAWGVVLTPAVGALLMSASTVIVAVNARMLRLKTGPKPPGEAELPVEPRPVSSREAKTVPKVASKPEAKRSPEPKPEAKVEIKPEADVAPTAEADVAPEPKAKVEASRPPVAPQVVQRVHELYEQLGREDVRAVQAWEDSQRENRKAESKPEAEPNPRAPT